MKYSRLLVAAGFAFAAQGAFAETGVNVADIGYVAHIYGRASAPAVKIVGPLVIRPADVNVAGREIVKGPTPVVVGIRRIDLNVNEVFGRA